MMPVSPEKGDVEENVRQFHDSDGWQGDDGERGEDKLFRQFRPAYYPYHDRVNARLLKEFDGVSGHLIIAGGGDLPETHVEIADRFSRVTCIDISRKALEIANQKLTDPELVLGSILDIPIPDNSFDAVYCAHVLYHIDARNQATAVRELIRVTKPGGKIVIIYGNPRSFPARLMGVKTRLRKLLGRNRRADTAEPDFPLYFFTFPLRWWKDYRDTCELRLVAWDVMSNWQEQSLINTDKVASTVYRFCDWFQKTFAGLAVRL